MEPVNISDPTLWATVYKIFGAGGIPLLLVCGGLSWLVRHYIHREKEKDAECQSAMEKAEARWETRFQQMRADVKEGFGIVAKLSEQVTILTAKVNGTRTP